MVSLTTSTGLTTYLTDDLASEEDEDEDDELGDSDTDLAELLASDEDDFKESTFLTLVTLTLVSVTFCLFVAGSSKTIP